MAKDYYATLGVAKGASADDLKKAYRKLAMELHPDRNPGNSEAEKRFKEINQAYDILKDPEKRQLYDRFGAQAFEGGAGPQGPRGGARGGAQGFGAFADIFDQMFGDFAGQRGGAQSQAHGADLRYNMTISLEEAFAGKQTNVRIPGTAACEVCKGSGAEAGSKPVTCATCQGRGRVRASQGFFTVERACPTCGGEGRTIDKPCRACRGEGRVHKEKTLQVSIPPGVEDGTRIRLAGEGETGYRGAPPGDLYIFLSVQPHPFFQREGADLFCRVPIPLTTAALGGQIEVPAIEGGRLKVQVTEGTQSGHRVRLKGKGMSVLRASRRGDLYVEMAVETPVKLNKKQRELLKAFEEAGDSDVTSPESSGFFAKMKEFFDGLKG